MRAAPSRLRRLAAFAIATVSSSALLSFGCVDFSSLTSGDDAGESTDATAAKKDASPAASDAGDAGGPFCSDANAHTHCFDFDESTTPDFAWYPGDFVSPPEGALSRDTGNFVSPPAALHTSARNGNHVGGTYVQLQEDLTNDLSGLVLSADMSIADTRGLTNLQGALLKVWYNVDPLAGDVTLGFVSNVLNVVATYPTAGGDGGYTFATYGTQISPPLDSGVWTHVDITVTFKPAWSVAVSFDGVPQTNTGPLAGSTSIADAAVTVGVGPIVIDDGGPLDVSYDNVTIDEQR